MASRRVVLGFVLGLMLAIGSLQPVGREALAQGASQRPADQDLFVIFKQRPSPAEEALLRAAGGQVRHRYTLAADAIAVRMPGAAIQGLQRNPNVLLVEPDIRVEAIHQGDVSPAEVANAWGVDRLDAELVHARSAAGQGDGVRLAIVDSGSGPHRWDLNVAERPGCLGQPCRAGSGAGYDDDHGHGTHVAGIAAGVAGFAQDPGGNQTYGGVVGMAPRATLVSFKVLRADGSGNYSDIVAALDALMQWSAANGGRLQIANFSLGSSQDPGVTVRTAFDTAYNQYNILSIAAAGNSGNPAGRNDNVIYPARYASVVAVCATDSADRRATFSSTGPAVEICAPGVNIWSTTLRDGYGYLSGTSMAAPHVAGAAALRAALNGGTNAQVRAALQASVKDLGARNRDTQFGFGLIDPLKLTGTAPGSLDAHK